jgi:transposase
VQLVIHARRFFCENPECPRLTFSEPFPGVLDAYARRTRRTQVALLELTHGSNAETAARLSSLLGYVVSPDTLIRLQRDEQFSPWAPSAMGVDEFAYRRNFVYGTIIVDLERHCPTDVLETDKSEELKGWLRRRPGAEVVARDRDGAYASAAREAAPDALQVADRFHLVHNVSDAMKEVLRSRRWAEPPSEEPPKEQPQAEPEQERRRPGSPTPLKQRRWEAVRELRQQGASIQGIARTLRMNHHTVNRYLSFESPPAYPPRRPQRRMLDPFVDYLRRRWEEGCHNARELRKEIAHLGYQGGGTQLQVMLKPWREPQAQVERLPLDKREPRPFWLLLRPLEKLTPDERARVEPILSANPQLARGHELKERFQRLVVQRDAAAVDPWLKDAAESDLPAFRRIARGIVQDYKAVRAALTTRWSNGQTEGQITRLKLIKRLGYGRAKPDLLRARVLHRMAIVA